jgi:stearoyl-CoA desaturase (Delta-9 desaturase)
MSTPYRSSISRTLQDRGLKRKQANHSLLTVVLMGTGLLFAIGMALLGIYPSLFDLLLLIFSYVLVTFGISVGFHRLFTHKSFSAHRLVQVVLVILGSMAMQGTLKFWVALHRRHHENSDAKGDPHSPYVFEDGNPIRSRVYGVLHSYFFWAFDHQVPNTAFYTRDLNKDALLSKINALYPVWVVLGLALPSMIGFAYHGTGLGALQGLVWGGMIRLFLGHNMIWMITCLTHVWGTRSLQSGDQSTNLGWLAIFTLGESWHNNHHSFPNAAVLSFEAHQVDISGWLILLLEKLGLVWNVHRPDRLLVAKRRIFY